MLPDDADDLPFRDRWVWAGVLNDLGLMLHYFADTRDLAVSLVEKYQDRHLADRVFDLVWTHSQVVLQQLNATEAESQLYVRLASPVIYANASLRASADVLIKNRRGQSGLWGYAISGDLPIVLLQIADGANIDLVRQLVQAHAYWRLKGLKTIFSVSP